MSSKTAGRTCEQDLSSHNMYSPSSSDSVLGPEPSLQKQLAGLLLLRNKLKDPLCHEKSLSSAKLNEQSETFMGSGGTQIMDVTR